MRCTPTPALLQEYDLLKDSGDSLINGISKQARNGLVRPADRQSSSLNANLRHFWHCFLLQSWQLGHIAQHLCLLQITAFVGFLSLAVANTVLLFAVGLDHGQEAETHGSKVNGAPKPTGMAAAGAAPAYHGNTDV